MPREREKPGKASVAEEHAETHLGSRIEIAATPTGPRLSIDSVPIRIGQDAGGNYYLWPYAYDRHKSLLEVARRYIDYRAKHPPESARSKGEG